MKHLTRVPNEPKARLSRAHSTYIPLASTVKDVALKTSGVTGVAAGFISAAGSGQLRVKVTEDSGSLLFKVRGPTAVQDVHVYAARENRDNVRMAIIKALRNDKRTIKIIDLIGGDDEEATA